MIFFVWKLSSFVARCGAFVGQLSQHPIYGFLHILLCSLVACAQPVVWPGRLDLPAASCAGAAAAATAGATEAGGATARNTGGMAPAAAAAAAAAAAPRGLVGT